MSALASGAATSVLPSDAKSAAGEKREVKVFGLKNRNFKGSRDLDFDNKHFNPYEQQLWIGCCYEGLEFSPFKTLPGRPVKMLVNTGEVLTVEVNQFIKGIGVCVKDEYNAPVAFEVEVVDERGEHYTKTAKNDWVGIAFTDNSDVVRVMIRPSQPGYVSGWCTKWADGYGPTENQKTFNVKDVVVVDPMKPAAVYLAKMATDIKQHVSTTVQQSTTQLAAMGDDIKQQMKASTQEILHHLTATRADVNAGNAETHAWLSATAEISAAAVKPVTSSST